ncbi:MAG: carboxypeptidase-like regulatory domain-containing protein, partial [Acidobacteria bacterium]|nr:carboxypeptidase-like regulatory domain-containing protein [Acidobacteriota bacterium]
MRAGRYKWPLFLALLSFLMSTVVGSAATLQGTVVDPQGAEVPGAVVRLLSSQGNEIAHTLTGER